MGKVCEMKGTARGLMSDYMRHLKLQHNYVSLKIKFQTTEYPHLGGNKHRSDGFNQIVEVAPDEEEQIVAEVETIPNDKLEEKTVRERDLEIAELKTQLDEQKKRLEEIKGNQEVSTVVRRVNFFNFCLKKEK